MKRGYIFWLLLICVITSVSVCAAQRWSRRRPARDAEGAIVDRRGVESWAVERGFRDDTFTFVRIAYRSRQRSEFLLPAAATDDAESQPRPIYLELTDPDCSNTRSCT
jgi:hypothetical protein